LNQNKAISKSFNYGDVNMAENLGWLKERKELIKKIDVELKEFSIESKESIDFLL